MAKLEDYVISVPDFPKEGIIFRDFTGILSHADGLKMAVDEIMNITKDLDYDIIAAAEARGFFIGGALSYEKQIPLVPVRKKGKLPRDTVSITFDLEYGTDTIEIHKDAIKPGQKVLIIDDLLATGGTTKATAELVERLGGTVAGIAVIIELKGLKGREVLKGYRVDSCIAYEGK